MDSVLVLNDSILPNRRVAANITYVSRSIWFVEQKMPFQMKSARESLVTDMACLGLSWSSFPLDILGKKEQKISLFCTGTVFWYVTFLLEFFFFFTVCLGWFRMMVSSEKCLCWCRKIFKERKVHFSKTVSHWTHFIHQIINTNTITCNKNGGFSFYAIQ